MNGYKKCPYCGEEIPENATTCMHCTAKLAEQRPEQTIVNEAMPPHPYGYQSAAPGPNMYAHAAQPQAAPVQPQAAPVQPQPVNSKNGISTAGLVLSILGLALCWVPFANLILWFLGILFSFIGVFKRPKGKAIAGLIISVVSIVVIILVFVYGLLLESDAFDELFYY